ncbi:electron transfer flavoprotein subunit alpha/FixB family protein [Saccharopolyspora endophytica]|uniref:Electron transfer flavoprotein subunit alpha/FixB family protein n=1 Tax=Saccharopolyspora endophytica TaxID=543886 RepID=A0ABS5DGZ9_9PSEU|nr:electron transfer flavoprotein subunit alpha/FixB family protein [Saccharopolyspora endophytica]MBQ0925569.1 electron transfer flavoprotein subunit alpha/FixB family protein [Saccharopolyspora endophytica]
MSEVLVLVEHSAGEVKKVTLELLTAARRLGSPSAVVVGEPGSTAKLYESLAAHGAEKIYAAEGNGLDDVLITPQVEVLASLTTQTSPAAVLVAASVDGKEIAGRLAVKLDSGLLSEAVDIDADGVASRSLFGGTYDAKAKVTKGTPVITVLPGSIEVEQCIGAAGEHAVEMPSHDGATNARITGRQPAEAGDRPELTEASIVVSGGRGIGSAEQFEVVEKLADTLGAAVGASRAAVDSGYYPHQFQVGQTGKTVSPQLYIALGISGAIQHRAGMQTSKTIVAINKDPEAPIFDIADYGIVGDLFTVTPQLTDEITTRKG